MTDSANHFDSFEDHTRLKHAILRAYLQTWAIKLLSPQGVAHAVHFIDAFAGEGQDAKGRDGSPLIALRVAVQLQGLRASGKVKADGAMLVTALEKVPKRFNKLQVSTASIVGLLGDQACVLQGTLNEQLDAVCKRAPSAPKLTFLDPFGVDGLEARILPHLLAGEKDEVFVLFSDVGVARLHGVVMKDPSKYFADYKRLRGAPTLFTQEQQREESEALAKALQKQKALERTEPRSRAILDAALGPEWVAAMSDHLEAEDLSVGEAAVAIFTRNLLTAGARFVQITPMRDGAGSKKYVLVHASKSSSAFVAMKESVSTSLNAAEQLDSAMCARIREDVRVEVAGVVEKIHRQFGGSERHWSKRAGVKGKRAEQGSVRRFVLETTPIYPFQMQEVKTQLKRRGWLIRRSGGNEMVRIPADDVSPAAD